ncbi:MAG TPA: hypothetical protein ENJ48_00295, partial [Anaerolineae bacterium]|nr:hypothetical protein [Anaerolineae bacterium]
MGGDIARQDVEETMTEKPLILLTNDDGIDSPVMLVLKKALNTVAETVIFAP